MLLEISSNLTQPFSSLGLLFPLLQIRIFVALFALTLLLLILLLHISKPYKVPSLRWWRRRRRMRRVKTRLQGLRHLINVRGPKRMLHRLRINLLLKIPSWKRLWLSRMMNVGSSFSSYDPFWTFYLAAIATKIVHICGPDPSKPLPITLSVSGGGFGEKFPSSVKIVGNGVKSIGVLIVNKDFSDFVEVDKSYWSKAVAPFMGKQVSFSIVSLLAWWVFRQYATPCDHCQHLGTQCHKLLTHTVKCVCCHYSKLPCKVDGVAVLNPVDHYHPKGYGNLFSSFCFTVLTFLL